MDSNRHQKIKEVFLAVVEQPRERWSSVLKEHTAGDDDLRHEVQLLLDFHVGVDGSAPRLGESDGKADKADKANKAETIRSVFILPSNSKEGCDPFFPKSNRPYETAAVANTQTGNVASLVLKGFSGSQNHRLVIINNHTFAAGETGSVVTPDGRVRLRCIEIKTNSAVIEVGGQRRELVYSKKP